MPGYLNEGRGRGGAEEAAEAVKVVTIQMNRTESSLSVV